MALLLILLAGYLLGSIPNGLLIGKYIYGVDIRQFGSKNIGATNAFRVLGPLPAFWVFITDFAKGVLGVYFVYAVSYCGILNEEQVIPLSLVLGGIAAIAGHNWSVFLSFNGGRGVATGLGVIAMLAPQATLFVFCVWLVIVLTTRYVSLASITAAALVPVAMWYLSAQAEIFYFGIVAAIFVIFRHRPNIERLLKGQETKIKAGRTQKPSA